MPYLFAFDYGRAITDVAVQQIVAGNPYYQQAAETAAIAEICSYLRPKYDVNAEFTPTLPYDPSKAYKAASRVYLDAAPYSATATYALNQLCLQGGKVYQCSTAINSGEAFNANHWTLLGNQYDLFFVVYPYALFNINAGYRRGDKVFWKDHVYTALQDSPLLTHEAALQYGSTNNLPLKNVFPDDLVYGRSYWHDEGYYNVPPSALQIQTTGNTITFLQAREDFSVTVGVTPGLLPDAIAYVDASLKGWIYDVERIGYGTMEKEIDYAIDADGGWHLLKVNDTFTRNERFVHHFQPVFSTTEPSPLPGSLTIMQQLGTYFTKGDNRNPLLLMYAIDMTIYHLYCRVAPKSIPQERESRYNAALSGVRAMMRGDAAVDIQKLQPDQGKRIRFGSQVKNITNY